MLMLMVVGNDDVADDDNDDERDHDDSHDDDKRTTPDRVPPLCLAIFSSLSGRPSCEWDLWNLSA